MRIATVNTVNDKIRFAVAHKLNLPAHTAKLKNKYTELKTMLKDSPISRLRGLKIIPHSTSDNSMIIIAITVINTI